MVVSFENTLVGILHLYGTAAEMNVAPGDYGPTPIALTAAIVNV